MLEVILFGVAAGLDNLQVCSSIGLMPMQRRRLHLLALGFCICELGGAVLGLFLGQAFLAQIGPLANGLAPLVMLACGLAILWLAFRNQLKVLPDFVNHKAVLFALPISLCFDNVIAGAGISFSSTPVLASAMVIGVISAAMACSGLYLANWLRRFMPRRIEMIAGAYLCFLAVRIMIAD
ncbi:manganese efflux pump MntP family protein [Undibacterium sp. Ji50W]|uniref:manganese efflux pump MntP n=1 Tax=Undibacterium sp. Ji50W TaxID=3413041 RepID=UPI003BF31A09